VTVQQELDGAIDRILDLLERAAAEGVDVNPLETIVSRLAARGQSMDMSQAPPMLRMVFSGMGIG
jgi:hypothetical protein